MKNNTKKNKAFGLFALGKTNKQIADAVGVTYNTVWTWRKEFNENDNYQVKAQLDYEAQINPPITKGALRITPPIKKGMKAWVAARNAEVDAVTDFNKNLAIKNTTPDCEAFDSIAFEVLKTENARLKNTLINIITRHPDVLA